MYKSKNHSNSKPSVRRPDIDTTKLAREFIRENRKLFRELSKL